MPTLGPENRPDNIAGFLSYTENYDALAGRVTDRRRKAELDRRPISSASEALANLFIEIGSSYIKAVYNEMPSDTAHLHPYYDGGFKRLKEEDKWPVRQAYAAVVLGISILTLTAMMEDGKGTFDRDYFLALYNHHMTGTAFPTVTTNDATVQSSLINNEVRPPMLNEDGEEIIPSENWEKLQNIYKDSGFVNFLSREAWPILPSSLNTFVARQGSGFAAELQTMHKDFSSRVQLLMRSEKEAQKKAMSMFYSTVFDFSLDPSSPRRPGPEEA